MGVCVFISKHQKMETASPTKVINCSTSEPKNTKTHTDVTIKITYSVYDTKMSDGLSDLAYWMVFGHLGFKFLIIWVTSWVSVNVPHWNKSKKVRTLALLTLLMYFVTLNYTEVPRIRLTHTHTQSIDPEVGAIKQP